MVTKKDKYTVDEVQKLDRYTDSFLCEFKDNIYDIKFVNFRVRDLDSGFVLFEVKDDGEDTTSPEELDKLDDEFRIIKYHLGPDFLDLKNIGTLLKFSVGPKPVKDFVLIERHYFRNRLVKSFEFKFDFCMPNSINEWETLYEIPELDPELKQQMIDFPWETKSDSFYFVEGNLVIHNKAIYNYSNLE